MAATSKQTDSSCFPSSSSFKLWDVFLSFGGKDTRRGFIDHLYFALDKGGIRTFKDIPGLERGEEIAPQLIRAIHDSKTSIVVFSKNYASSKWCLTELVEILECERTEGQIVLPVFYDVDPLNVRHQTESYAEAFEKHKIRYAEKIETWRTALSTIANISGYDLKNDANGYEVALIQKIVNDIRTKFCPKYLNDTEHQVGIDSRVKLAEDLPNKPMEETFLASFVVVVFDLLTSDEVKNVATQLGIKPRLKVWKKYLEKILTVLADAELKQYVNTNVKKWLNKLEDLAYDMDDTIDGFVTDQVGKRLHSQASSSSQVSSNQFSTATDLTNKIDEISFRLEKIVGKINGLSLKENNNIFGGIQLPSSTSWERFPSSSLAQPHVYGREEEEKAILKILLEGDEASFDPKCVDKWVVPIVGMGGVGKTTLAQRLYNDKEVNSFFDLKAWACVGLVSGKFDVLGVTKKILESLTEEPCDLKELDPVQVRLQKKLLGRKFLVVLDDIWKIECDEWNRLNLPFLAGARGSKIILTTRSVVVAKNMSRIKIRKLKQLGDDDSLSLLARHALERKNFEEHRDLEEIGEKILKKCQGLPLAITTIGGLLRTTEHQIQWKHILHSKVWDLKGPILPALLLSYHYLPSHLKRCFGACAIIPKDCAFSKRELILLWMAMGLLRGQSREMNCVEDFGARCFDELLSRSFFQNSARRSEIGESQFIMHYLIIDVAESVAGEICCRWEETKISKRARYSSFTGQLQTFKDFNSVQQLRTIMPFGRFFGANNVLVDLVPKFKFLRALRLAGESITELPDYIGELKHLRHLDLSTTNIRVLPASICTLSNLLTLSVMFCDRLHTLPADIGNLINLRHLDNADTFELKEMPCGISKLASLQTLSKFVVGKGSGLKLRVLKDLMLRRSLSICGLEDVMDSQDAEEASLELKHDLDELELVWESDDDHHHDEELEFDVLDKLKPQRNLKKLGIYGYRCSKISSWVGDPSFRELTELSIDCCRNCTSLPPLWELPMLKHLNIRDCDNFKSLSFNQIQRNLEKLVIFGCPELETFPDWDLLPNLTSLLVENCGKHLKPLSEWGLHKLASLEKFVIYNCFDDYDDGDDQQFLLPSTLTELEIVGLSNLESLSYLQNLSSLKSLYLENCPKLGCLPKGEVLSNLSTLCIASCPILEKRIKYEGYYQPILASIPRVLFNDMEFWNLAFENSSAAP